ncbi:hypothetical protein ACFQ46_05525 [Kineococcus sp. GCM10028916]|uniref:hypothetical protein n=1 Tax=Kineococcus sp. GCM10028916 TaxID=3273394 RepID=UPI00362E8369
MSRRGPVLTVSAAAAVSVASLVALSISTHASLWWLYRDGLAHLAGLDPQTVSGFPPAEAPRVLDSIGQSVGFLVPFVAVVALGTALALAGRRWWAVGAVVGLDLAGVVDRFPLTGGLLLPADPSLATLPAGWPWDEIALDVGLGLLPVLVAVLTGVPTAVTRPALRRSGVAALVVLVIGTVLHPVDLDAAAVLHAALAVLVVASTGVVATGRTSRQLICGAAVLVVLVAARALLGGSGFPVLGVVTVLAGPVAVLATPSLTRAWATPAEVR